MTNTLTDKVLSASQREFLKKLEFTNAWDFYLAGGTALALQIGHRRSVDFDFYTRKHFKKGEILDSLRPVLGRQKRKVVRDINDTYEIAVEPDIHISCFHYPYPLLVKPQIVNGVSIASLEDIAAMKIIALAQRGLRRDFIDLYYLLRRFSLREIFRFTQKKYPEFDIHHGLRSILYFKDADEDVATERALVFDKRLTWSAIKKGITEAVTQNFPHSLE
jgi:hypothetical protein